MYQWKPGSTISNNFVHWADFLTSRFMDCSDALDKPARANIHRISSPQITPVEKCWFIAADSNSFLSFQGKAWRENDEPRALVTAQFTSQTYSCCSAQVVNMCIKQHSLFEMTTSINKASNGNMSHFQRCALWSLITQRLQCLCWQLPPPGRSNNPSNTGSFNPSHLQAPTSHCLKSCLSIWLRSQHPATRNQQPKMNVKTCGKPPCYKFVNPPL